MSAPYITQRKEILSHCCGASIMEDSDICTKCKEHCQGEVICDICEGTGKADEIDKSKITSQINDVPYKKGDCGKCGGEGFIVIDL